MRGGWLAAAARELLIIYHHSLDVSGVAAERRAT